MESPRLPAELGSVLERLAAAGVRAHVVGGCLRDALLGRPPRDFDVLVEAPLERVRNALPEAALIAAKSLSAREATRRIRPWLERYGAAGLVVAAGL